jgi:hypothetical protein
MRRRIASIYRECSFSVLHLQAVRLENSPYWIRECAYPKPGVADAGLAEPSVHRDDIPVEVCWSSRVHVESEKNVHLEFTTSPRFDPRVPVTTDVAQQAIRSFRNGA